MFHCRGKCNLRMEEHQHVPPFFSRSHFLHVVVKAHSNIDFDLAANFRGGGGLDGLFRTLFKQPEPPKVAAVVGPPVATEPIEAVKASDSSEKPGGEARGAGTPQKQSKDPATVQQKTSDGQTDDKDVEATGTDSQEASQQNQNGVHVKKDGKEEVDPRDCYKRATTATALAIELLASAKKYAEAPPRLNDDFIASNFPVDPTDGKYQFWYVLISKSC